MKRWHDEVVLTTRNWRNHRRMHVESNKNHPGGRIGISAYEVDCECDEQKGRFRKRDAYDCGNPRCWVCSCGKFPKRKRTHRERQVLRSLREQVRELQE